MLSTGEVAGTLRLRHTLEIAKRLERADGKAEIAAELANVAGAAVERQQVILENLDLVEAGAGDRAELFIERTAQCDGGDRTFGHAICSRSNASRRSMRSRCSVADLYLTGDQYRPTMT